MVESQKTTIYNFYSYVTESAKMSAKRDLSARMTIPGFGTFSAPLTSLTFL